MPLAKIKAGSPVFINVDQAKRSTSVASPCKNQRHNSISGHGGIGRLGGFRYCHLSEGFLGGIRNAVE